MRYYRYYWYIYVNLVQKNVIFLHRKCQCNCCSEFWACNVACSKSGFESGQALRNSRSTARKQRCRTCRQRAKTCNCHWIRTCQSSPFCDIWVFPALHGLNPYYPLLTWFAAPALNLYTLPAMATAQESRSAPAVWKNGALPFETIANHCVLMESRAEPGCTVAGWSGDYRHVVDLSGIQIQAFTSHKLSPTSISANGLKCCSCSFECCQSTTDTTVLLSNHWPSHFLALRALKHPSSRLSDWAKKQFGLVKLAAIV